MTPEFLAAVIDTLLPGDETLPSGTRAGLDPAVYVGPHRAMFEAIVGQADGSDPFVRANEGARAVVLRAVERTAPDLFRALLTAILSDYYEASPVLTTLGWHTEPPQPTGHTVPTIDVLLKERLDRVRQRGKLWRG